MWTCTTKHTIDVWIIDGSYNGGLDNRGSTVFIAQTKCRMIQFMYYLWMTVAWVGAWSFT